MNCINDPVWVRYFIALTTPLIAIITVYIAYKQWKTANNKLNFDLYSKRFALYEFVRDNLQPPNHLANQDKMLKDERQFNAALRESKWLFGNDIYKELEQIANRRILLNLNRHIIHNISSLPDEKNAASQECVRLCDLLRDSFENIANQMGKYLKLH